MPSLHRFDEPVKKMSKAPLVILAVLLVGGAAAAYFLTRGSKDSGANEPSTTAPAAAPTGGTAPTAPAYSNPTPPAPAPAPSPMDSGGGYR